MAEDKVYLTEYAGKPVRYTFRSPGTAALFGNRLRIIEGTSPDVYESEEFFEKAKRLMPFETSEYAEFRSLICLTSKKLLLHGCCFLHSAAFEMDCRAWLLSAPSGTGKTTQFLNWQRLFPGEVRMISGDVPLIEAREDGVFAHPSPWNGKEGLGDPKISAPIGGVVLLEQGGENCVETLTVAESVYKLMSQFIVLLETEDEVRQLSSIVDRLLRAVPVRKFVNTGTEESTELLRRELKLIAYGEGRPE